MHVTLRYTDTKAKSLCTPNVFKNRSSSSYVKDIDICITRWKFQLNLPALYEVSSIYVKRKWSYCVEAVKNLKTPNTKMDRGPPHVMVNKCVKYNQITSKENGIIMQKL